MPIPPIDDSYIDAIIKSDGPYNPSLNRTQGVKLRELMKRFRDFMEQTDHYKGNYASLIALEEAHYTALAGDYATVDPNVEENAQIYIWDVNNTKWVLSSGGAIADATELAPGIIELATIAEALTRTDDQKAMTALKTIALILDEKKEVSYQVNPVGVTEVSFLMENAGQVNAILISGANSPKLKIGANGPYPEGEQVLPFAYSANDRVFVSFNYNDLLQMSCNIKLKCKDN